MTPLLCAPATTPALMGKAVLALPTGKRVGEEFVISEAMLPGDTAASVFARVAQRLGAHHAEVLSVLVYGSMDTRAASEAALREVWGEAEWPLTWVEGASCTGQPLAGVQVFAVAGRDITRVRLGRRVVASVYEDGEARHCLLGGFGPSTTLLQPAAQVQQTLANLEAALELAGFGLSDVIRTWFYNDAILDWYNDFNRVRSALYKAVRFRTGSLPASTAVSGRNPMGAALAVAARAMQPLNGDAGAREVGSPLQCPAPAYGSSFSRAMELEVGGMRQLLISGTASIHPGGETAWVDNPARQVAMTMKVVTAILQSRGMNWSDVTRAIAYCKQPEYRVHFESWCAEHGLELPVFAVHCDICRDDLLFEIELDAAVERLAEAG